MSDWSAADYARNADFVSRLGEPLLDELGPVDGMSVLDLGCGDGELAAQLRERGATVTGIDASTDMIRAALARGLDARVADGQEFAASVEDVAPFDAVFTNAALHWMPDANAVLSNVANVLKPGAPFIGEAGGHGNVAAIATALLAALQAQGIDGHARWPWRFPTAASWQTLLKQHGFKVERCLLIPRPTLLPTDIKGWLRTLALPFLDGVDDTTAQFVHTYAQALLAPSLLDADGRWTADYVRLRFKAFRQ